MRCASAAGTTRSTRWRRWRSPTAIGCPLAPMLHGLREYRGEPHRVEPVAIVDEVEYFDDSKGTNVGATVAALIGLGAERARQARRDPRRRRQGPGLRAAGRAGARATRAPCVLIGRDAPVIEAALASAGVAASRPRDARGAVTLAAGRAQPGDAVLLSPACASFDMFRNYAHRAEVFVDAVQALVDAPRGGGSAQERAARSVRQA